jgi:hypothetical protein
MPVAQLDEDTLVQSGLNKPTPRRARAPREPEELKEVVVPTPVTEEDPLHMPNPVVGEDLTSEEEPEEMTTTDLYKTIFDDKHREITKNVLMNSDEGKELLAEMNINTDVNQLSAWETQCISQLRSSLSQYQEIEELEVVVHLQVNLPFQPFSFIVKR